jgi:TATA-binding protein-associated factor
LVCVLALDRFADYVSDTVIVPVRETVAQTLGVLMQFCEKDLCLATSQALLTLIGKGGWETRHAGLIGLKYWMGVRGDLVGDALVDQNGGETGIFKAIIAGLGYVLLWYN